MRKAEIAQLLPGVFLRTLDPDDPTGPLDALLDAMETLQAPSEHAIAGFSEQLNPTRASPAFLALLAQWVYLDRGVLPEDPSALRRLVSEASDLWRWRGTRIGLERFLTLVHGRAPLALDESAKPFHLVVQFPGDSRSDEARIDLAVRLMKPAHVTHSLKFEDP